jgi:hypothetical protein
MAEVMRKASAIIKETATGDYPTDQSGTGDCEEHRSGSMPATHSTFIPAGIPRLPAT